MFHNNSFQLHWPKPFYINATKNSLTSSFATMQSSTKVHDNVYLRYDIDSDEGSSRTKT